MTRFMAHFQISRLIHSIKKRKKRTENFLTLIDIQRALIDQRLSSLEHSYVFPSLNRRTLNF